MSALNIIQVWAAYKSLDERGTCGERVGVYSTKELASIGARDHGYWGGPGKVVPKKAIQHEGLVYLLEGEGEGASVGDQEVMAEFREKVAAKLDPEERRALGL